MVLQRFSLLVLLLACGCSKSLDIALDVVPACDAPDALAGLAFLKVRAEGAGIDAPRDEAFELGRGSGRLEGVPPTPDATLTITAYRTDPTLPADVGGALGAIDLSGQRAGAHEVRVFIGPVDSFVRTSQGAAPSACTALNEGRQGHTVTRLNDGRVLVAGGEKLTSNVSELVRQTEIFDPPTGTWSSGPELPEGRAYHTATLLKSNKVLLCGGLGLVNGRTGSLQSCALLDLASKRFVDGGVTMVTSRLTHTATLLDDGRVLMAGGRSFPVDYLDSTEIYTETGSGAGTFAAGPPLANARAQHTAHVLANNRVALIGGRLRDSIVSSVEVWSDSGAAVMGSLTQPRYGHAAAALPDGRIAIGGGFVGIGDAGNPAATAAIEIYDPAVGSNGKLSCGEGTLNLSDQRGQLTAASVAPSGTAPGGVVFFGGTRPDGQVVNLAELLVAGRSRGCSDLTVRNTASPLRLARTRAEAVPLLGGDVLVVGGSSTVGITALPVPESELYIIQR